MAQTTQVADDRDHTDAIGRHYLIRFDEETLKQRPLWIRVIIEFLGTALLVTVAAGAGVINRYAGGNPVSRTAAVVAGWWVYVLGPLIGASIAVMIIGLVRGLPVKEEREAAEGGALPQ